MSDNCIIIDEGDSFDFQSGPVVRTARKEWVCCECGDEIQLKRDRQYQRAPDRFVISDGEPSELTLARLAKKRRVRRRREFLFMARISVGEVQRRHIVKPWRRSAAVIERKVILEASTAPGGLTIADRKPTPTFTTSCCTTMAMARSRM